jgi:hypothetical protein
LSIGPRFRTFETLMADPNHPELLRDLRREDRRFVLDDGPVQSALARSELGMIGSDAAMFERVEGSALSRPRG